MRQKEGIAMAIRTTLVGKISKLKKDTYQDKTSKEPLTRTRVEFTLAEVTGRKHPEGHKYAGKAVIEFHRVKCFNDKQAEFIHSRYKDGDYIAVDGEMRFDHYTRKDVEVEVKLPTGTIKLKVDVPEWPTMDFVMDNLRFTEDAPSNSTDANSTPVNIEDGLAGELAALAASQSAGTASSVPTENVADSTADQADPNAETNPEAADAAKELVAAGATGNKIAPF
jgi:single-stranded DNA-binding protein